MNSKFRITAATATLACVAGLGASTAVAEHPAGPTCMDIHWNAELLKA